MSAEEHSLLFGMLRWSAKWHWFKTFAEFYIDEGPLLVERMLAANADWTEVAAMNAKVLRLLEANEMIPAALNYGDMLVALMTKYWPDCRNPLYTHSVRLLTEAKERVAAGQTLEGVIPQVYAEQGLKTLPPL